MTSGRDEVLRRGFTAATVSAAAGVARRTFYDNFPTVDDYVDALLDHISKAADHEVTTSVGELFSHTDGALRAVVEALVTEHLVRVSALIEVRAAYTIELMGLRGAPTKRSAPWRELVEELEEFGYEAVPPLNSEDVVDAIRALLDGFSLASAARAAAPPADRATEAVLGMLASMTTPRHAQSGTETVETMSRHVKTSWSERTQDRPVANVRRLVLDAVAEEVATRGTGRLDLTVLSERTGLSVSAISRYVGSRRHILEALLDRIYPGLLVALARDVEAGDAPETVLHSHLQRFAALIEESPEYAGAELSLWSPTGTERESRAGRELMETTGRLLASTANSPESLRLDHLTLGEWAMRVVALGTPETTRRWSRSILVGLAAETCPG